MDESVICIEDPVEIIDLSDTVNENNPAGNSRNDLYEEFFIRDKVTTRNQKKNGQLPPVIDLSNESDTELSKESPRSRRSCDMCCPICFEKLSNVPVKATICGHVFCSNCIETAVRQKKTCPKCRKKLTLKSLISLYL